MWGCTWSYKTTIDRLDTLHRFLNLLQSIETFIYNALFKSLLLLIFLLLLSWSLLGAQHCNKGVRIEDDERWNIMAILPNTFDYACSPHLAFLLELYVSCKSMLYFVLYYQVIHALILLKSLILQWLLAIFITTNVTVSRPVSSVGRASDF